MELATLICPSKIVSVTVYARGAVVTRRAELPESLSGDPLEVILPGVTPLANPGSLRVEVDGEREVVGIRSTLVFPEAPGDPGMLRKTVETIEETISRLDAQKALCEANRSRLLSGNLQLSTSHGLRKNPRGRFKDALASSALVDELLEDEDQHLAELNAELEDQTRRLEAARLALSQADTKNSARGTDPERRLLIQLAPGDGGLVRLDVSYAVDAARWWPAYAVRLDQGATHGKLSLEAFVAQSSGEDWDGVSLGLCTADMIQDVTLPELPSLRLGRRQPPKQTGYRPLPTDLGALFEGFDKSWGGWSPPSLRDGMSDESDRVRGGLEPELLMDALKSEEVYAEAPADLSFADKSQAITLSAGPMGPPQPEMKKKAGKIAPKTNLMPVRQASRSIRPMPAAAKSSGLFSFGGGGGGGYIEEEYDDSYLESGPPGHAPEPLPEVIAISAEAWLRFDMLVLRPPTDAARRGQLEMRPKPTWSSDLKQSEAALRTMAAPFGTTDPVVGRQFFDHRYDADGLIDLPSNGQAHRLPMTDAEADCNPVFVTNPRQTAEVYREIRMTNPFGAPLLTGPIDVFVAGALVRTSPLEAVDRGGEIRFGLGVEERVRVARKAVTREASVGLLKGTTSVETTVTIELASALTAPAEIVVFDRVPVTHDKEVEIETPTSTPAAVSYDQKERGKPVQGGLRWHIELQPGAERKIVFSYTIALPSKRELVGGNRRE